MNTAGTRARAPWRLVVLAGASALVLAGCGVAKAVTPSVRGTPALSISVPLTNVGCTSSNVCAAVGTSSTGVGPSTVGEFTTPNGRWHNLTPPGSASPQVVTSACSPLACLFGGSQPGSDLLWRFSATSETLGSVTPPPGGIGVVALSCRALDCALVDTTSAGESRFSVSTDAGTSWSPPVVMTWASSATVTALACASALECVVAASAPHHLRKVFTTNDAGTSWSAQTLPSSWTALRSLSCDQQHCVALVSAGGSSLLVRSTNFARTWSSVTLSERANALACSTTLSTCVIAGQSSQNGPWLDIAHRGTLRSETLRYVPTALVDVACGQVTCAAVGATTLLTLALPR